MHREITAMGEKKKVILRQTPRAVTPFGGLSVLIEFLQKIGYRQQVSECMPVRLRSPNAIDPGETYTAFLMAVVAGARRFAHTAVLHLEARNPLHDKILAYEIPTSRKLEFQPHAAG